MREMQGNIALSVRFPVLPVLPQTHNTYCGTPCDSHVTPLRGAGAMRKKEPFTPAKQKRNQRAYQRKVAEHRCVCCGQQDERTLSGRIYCQECLDRHNAANPRKKLNKEQREHASQYKRDVKQWYLEHQVCMRCKTKDKHTLAGHLLCARCAAKQAKHRRDKYDAEKMNAYHKSRRDAWREQGLCTNCGGKKEEPDKMMCIDCRVRARMRHAARQRKKKEQDG